MCIACFICIGETVISLRSSRTLWEVASEIYHACASTAVKIYVFQILSVHTTLFIQKVKGFFENKYLHGNQQATLVHKIFETNPSFQSCFWAVTLLNVKILHYRYETWRFLCQYISMNRGSDSKSLNIFCSHWKYAGFFFSMGQYNTFMLK
jgi:hypothetical protein